MSNTDHQDTVRVAGAHATASEYVVNGSRKPVFVGINYQSNGRGAAPAGSGILASDTYMTAPEMQSTVALLTGFLHPDFETFASSLGTIDGVTGRRTTDRPSLVAVLFFRRVSAEIGAAVIERESFVDDEERIVFGGVDLERSPSDSELTAFVARLYEAWLGNAIGAENLNVLTRLYRQRERSKNATAAYQALIEVLLQHGGIYFLA